MCRAVFGLLVLAAAVANSTCEQTQEQGSQRAVLQVIILTEDNPSADQQYATSKRAVDTINNASDILPEYQLQLVRSPGGCDSMFGLAPYQVAQIIHKGLQDTPNLTIAGVIGPTCSKSALYLGSLLQKTPQPQPFVNIHLASSYLLESRSNYPNSFGMVGSSRVLFHSASHLIRSNNWTVVSVLYDETDLYHSSALYNTDQTLRVNHTIKEYFVSATHPGYIPLPELKLKSRIAFLFLTKDLARAVLCMAYHMDIVFPAYQFVLMGVLPTVTLTGEFSFVTEQNTNFTCTSEEMKAVLSGVVFTNFQFSGNIDGLDRNVNTVSDTLDHNISQQLLMDNPAVYFYPDALWSLALALNASEITTQDWADPTFKTSDVIRQELSNVQLPGGIKFSNSTGFVKRGVYIQQYLDDTLILLSILEHDHSGVSEIAKGQLISWEIRRIHTSFVYLPKPVAYVGLGFTAAVLLLVMCMHILTLLFRNHKPVKASSYKLLQLTFIGSYLCLLSIVAHSFVVSFSADIQNETTCHFWHILNASLSLGTMLISSTLCVRTWRIYKIFVYYRNPGSCLSDTSLTLVVCVCASVVILIAVLWAVIDPLKPTVIDPSGRFSLVRDSNGSVRDVEITVDLRCRIKRGFLYLLWHFLTYIPSVTLGMILFFLIYKTRKIPQKDFKTLGIMRMNYIAMFGSLILLSMYTVLLQNSNFDTLLIRYILFTLILGFLVICVCILLYLPPLYPVLQLKFRRNFRKRTF